MHEEVMGDNPPTGAANLRKLVRPTLERPEREVFKH